ncbi:MAG: hypothetical protein ACREAA_19485 [Candidatus Polarisedimenticolia bacterium]
MRRILTASLFAALAWIPAGARAEMPGDVPDRWRIDLGGMASSSTTQASVTSTDAGFGLSVNLEDVFDMPESRSVVRFAGSWHFTKRQYLDFGQLSISRTGIKSIEEDVDWGRFEFDAGAEVTSTFDADFPYLAWRWDFLQDPRVHISGSVGIIYLGVEASLEATGGVTDPNGVPITRTVNEEASVQFPVPQIGLQVDWAVGKRVLIKLYSRLIYVDFADIRGAVGEQAIRFYWYFSRHVGFAVGLETARIDLKEYVSGDTKSKFDYNVSGLTFYIATAF